MRSRLAEERAVSTTLGYVLTLTITAVLISGLLIAGGSMVEDQRDRIAQQELSVAAEQLASGLHEGDRLAETSTGGAIQVSIWLPERIAGGSYTLELINQSTVPGQPATATIQATAQGANAEATLSLRTGIPVANQTVIGGPLVVTHRDVDGDDRRELVVNESRGHVPGAPEPASMSHEEIVFVDADTGELSSVGAGGTVTQYGVDAAAVGPKEVDVDGDGLREIPFVDASNRLRIVDAAGEVQTLATDAAKSPLQNSSGTAVAVGKWNGTTSVYFMNTADVGPNGEATIYRVDMDGQAEQVTVGGSAVEANAVIGIGDVDDDGDSDLVYVGHFGHIRYLDDGGKIDTGQSVGANTGIGAGAPRQFDTGETDRIPFVSGNNVRLLSHQGGSSTVTDLTTGGTVESTFVAGVDLVGDDRLEVVFVDSSSGTLKYVRLGGPVSDLTDEAGNTITVNESTGVA